MKRAYLILLALPIITSCSCKSRTSEESITPFSYDDSFNLPTLEAYSFRDRSFVDFPSFNTPSENLTYELSEDESYYIVSDRNYGLSQADLVIPSSYNSLPVKEIASEGFAYKTWLNSVYIPRSITKIGDGAFNSSALKKVYYDAENVSDFNAKNWVFFKADAAQSIDIYFGPNVKRIPSRLFFPLVTSPDSVPVVNNIYFAKNSIVEEIGDYAFYLLDKYKSLSLPDSVTSIGDYAFYNCSLEELVLPSKLYNIGKYAFAFSSLENISINNELKDLEEGAFSYCGNLKQVDLSKSKLTKISQNCFQGNENLKIVVFNNLTEVIEDYAFEGSFIEILDMPSTLKEIGNHAFANLVNLKQVRLNESLEKIGDYGFYNAANVEKFIIFSKNLEDFRANNHTFEKLGQISKKLIMIFEESVETIPSRMFLSSVNKEDNPNIKQIILPISLKEIKDNAFYETNIVSIDYLGSISQFNKIKVGYYNNVLSAVKCHG